MVCVYCGHKTDVSNSRPSKKHSSTWRRRECRQCHSIFTTREQVDYSGALRVRTSSGALQPFLRDKLFLSVYQSLSHRKSPDSDATALIETIIEQILPAQTTGLLEVTILREITTSVLQRFDKVACVHYQAHHTD